MKIVRLILLACLFVSFDEFQAQKHDSVIRLENKINFNPTIIHYDESMEGGLIEDSSNNFIILFPGTPSKFSVNGEMNYKFRNKNSKEQYAILIRNESRSNHVSWRKYFEYLDEEFCKDNGLTLKQEQYGFISGYPAKKSLYVSEQNTYSYYKYVIVRYEKEYLLTVKTQKEIGFDENEFWNSFDFIVR